MKVDKIAKACMAAAWLAALCLSGPVAAFNQGETVTIGDLPIFDITASAEGFSAAHRAWQAQDALDNALFLTANAGPHCVTVERLNAAYALKLGGRYITTADAGSATNAGLSCKDLADKWAHQLQMALSDPSRVATYVATLKDPNLLEGEYIAEHQIYAPAGTILPVSFNKNLNATMVVPGERIEGRIVTNVPVGNSFFVPADSQLIGEVRECRPGVFTVHMDTLRTPGGREVPIDAVVSDRVCTAGVLPHAVATVEIPASGITNTRLPAVIGIGTGVDAPVTALTFTRDSGFKISANEPTNVVIERVSSVAVVPGRQLGL